MLKPVNAFGWFIIDTLAGLKDRESDLRRGMTESLDRIAAIVEGDQDELPTCAVRHATELPFSMRCLAGALLVRANSTREEVLSAQARDGGVRPVAR